MNAVLAFLVAHWKGVVVGVGSAALGAYLGRLTAPRPVPVPCPACPEVHCVAQADAGVQTQSDCQAKVVVKYVMTDAGCPEAVVSVDSSGHSSGTAGATSTGESYALPPTVVIQPGKTVYVPGPTWELGGGVGISMAGRLTVPVGVRWYPQGGTLGLGVEGNMQPSDWKQSSIGLSVNARW